MSKEFVSILRWEKNPQKITLEWKRKSFYDLRFKSIDGNDPKVG